MHKIFFTLILFFLIFSVDNFLSAQVPDSIKSNISEQYYVDLYMGFQVSGIRKEDYVGSNFSPYLQISIGKLITPTISININYQGPCFKFIGDNYNHNYQFFGSDLIINMNNLINNKYSGVWKLYLFAGPGILFNNYLNKTNFSINGGLINEYRFKTIGIKLKISAIAGYRIYQNDKDVLTNLSLGVSKYF